MLILLRLRWTAAHSNLTTPTPVVINKKRKMRIKIPLPKYTTLTFLFICLLANSTLSYGALPKGTLEKSQSFNTVFANFKKVQFATYSDFKSSPSKVHFYLLRDGNVVIELPEFYGNEYWAFYEVVAVSFKDVNSDGLKDILIIAEYTTGIGPTGTEPFTVNDVFFQASNKFIKKEKISELLNDRKSYPGTRNILSMEKYLRSLNIR